MFWISIFLKALLLINVCQGLTILENRPNDEKYSLKSNYPTMLTARIANQIPQQTAGHTLSKILNPLNNSNIIPVQYQQHHHLAHIAPYRFMYLNPKHTTSTIVSEQPVAAVSIESEIINAPFAAVKLPTTTTINFNNEVYHHINKEASPLANNNKKYLKFIVRKQRNLKNNHNNDDDVDVEKFIEQNSREIHETSVNGLDDLNEAASLSSAKQPSSTESTSITSHEIRYLHDIFLNYPKPHHVNFGHVELSPVLFGKRFETLKAGNRYKGEVMWLDSTGGYAQHYWDLAQGKL